MLKVEIGDAEGKRKPASCQMMGTTEEIYMETLDAIGMIYLSISEEFSPAEVMNFRKLLTVAVLDPSSPIWNTKPKNGEKLSFRMPEGGGS